jgi:hypothetical protein
MQTLADKGDIPKNDISPKLSRLDTKKTKNKKRCITNYLGFSNETTISFHRKNNTKKREEH